MHLERNKFDLFRIPELDPQKRTQSVYSFEIDHKGRLLAGVLSLGFVVYDMDKDEFFHYSQLPEYKAIASKVDLNTVNSFLWDKDSVLWMGTRYNGIITLNPRTGEIDVINSETTNNAFKGRSVNVLFLDEDGSVWAGTWNGLNHIISIEGQQRIITNTTFLDPNNEVVENVNVTGILNDNKGNLLIASLTNGMFSVSPQKEKPIATEWEVVKVPYKIISVFQDTGQRIWIGTKGNGIKLIEKNSSELISPLTEGNVLGDVVFGINQDEYGSIWLTTNRGLLKLWFQQQIPQTERFLYRDGLQGNIFIPRAFFKDKNGHFYVGGNHGFNIFNPLKVNGNYSKAPVVITDILVGGEHMPYYQGETNTLRLNHIQNDFSVTFSALEYLHPEANQYAYMVEGIDNDWKYVTSKMRSANYSNLLAGDYVLKIKGSNGQGVWNDTYLSLNIHVKQAPYKTWWAILIYLALIIGIIWAIFLQRLKIERIKQDYQLQLIKRSKSEKLNQFKLKFFTNISHELLTPLSILSAAIENGLKERKFSMNNQLLMQRNVNGLLRLIRQLLTFRKLETGNMTLKLVKGDISSFVSNCVDDFTLLSQKQVIQFKVDVEPNIMGVFDKEKMEIILRNLLSNAFRYTNDGGEIVFSLRGQANPDVIHIIVKDTGIGISEESLPYLFDRFYRDENNKENDKSGMGIGLSLTKNLVSLLNGKIDVVSALGEGSTFSVELPIGEEAFVKAESYIADEDSLKNITIPIEEERAEPEDEDLEVGVNLGYTILVADDNDDFRFTVKESLKKSFNILEARDGQEAFNIAMSDDVDLIVSDVMMPNLSGKELCKAVKSNINISHIPIILLSAKVGDQNKLLGYEAGADSYLEKPVSLRVLKVRINGLLAIREKFKNKVSSDFNLEPENTSITPLDEKFIMKAKAYVEENLSDSEFSVKSLANELGVSNSMLYRKIRSLVGLAPNEFIRNIRLKRAAQMLKNKSFTISEVAFNCGFNDLGYFGVCFKKRFGKTPTIYQTGESEKK
jgi:signal transduction histidine kinase/DNA-binding response OmpR family regulator